MKTKNGYILTFSEKMQISAILCFATCDWFCPMMSHIKGLLFMTFKFLDFKRKQDIKFREMDREMRCPIYDLRETHQSSLLGSALEKSRSLS